MKKSTKVVITTALILALVLGGLIYLLAIKDSNKLKECNMGCWNEYISQSCSDGGVWNCEGYNQCVGDCKKNFKYDS